VRTRIINQRTGETIAKSAEVASNPLVRMRGLLGRRSMASGEAIILRPASSIHTMFMLFSIDVIYVDSADVVVKIVRNLAPFRFSAALAAHTAIEMAGGCLTTTDLSVGDRLIFEPDGTGEAT
jgi:uncharacterized protein